MNSRRPREKKKKEWTLVFSSLGDRPKNYRIMSSCAGVGRLGLFRRLKQLRRAGD